MSDRLRTLKEKWPDRHQRLDAILYPLCGMQRQYLSSAFAREALDQLEARVLAALYGDPDPTTVP